MKKKLTLFTAICFMATGLLFAEDSTEEESNWKFSGFFQQSLNQVAFTNWAAGGENSFSSTSQARFDANYKKNRYKWENYIDMHYGIIKISDNPVRKNVDKIDLFSKLGREINEKLSYTAIVNFQSQFDKGYNYPNDSVVVSRFMAPGYLTAALGFDYKPVEFLSIFASPTTGKFTFVLDDDLSAAGAFGVDPGKNVNPEFGAMVRIEFNKEVVTNVNVNSRIVLFNNYTDSDASNRKNTDVDWLTQINMPINTFLTVTAGFHLLYDHDIKIDKGDGRVGPTTQMRQQFGIGFVYNFK
jgi:hypothetical protein